MRKIAKTKSTKNKKMFVLKIAVFRWRVGVLNGGTRHY